MRIVAITVMAGVFKSAWPYQKDAMNLPVRSVDEAVPYRELAPAVIAVSGEQRVVEIEQREAHRVYGAGRSSAIDGCNNSRASGTVTARFVASE